MIFIAGPCVIEKEDVVFKTCEFLLEEAQKYKFEFYFKTSYDKANRSSIEGYRGPGVMRGSQIFEKLKKSYNVKILTDVHNIAEVPIVKDVVDVIQIPALLCRQTDLLNAAAASHRIVNVKKGQFMAPWDMRFVVDKLKFFEAVDIWLTERGTTFGYNNLVVDFRSLPVMRQLGVKVIFDATHSVQLPSKGENSSTGERDFVPYLTRAAVACGVDGLFMEVHPDPDKALCDAYNMIDFNMARRVLKETSIIVDNLWS
jgi:2-dehydro-3-deoxyphosphooctonate aldolase (KDO 8-P synthase)